MTEPKKPTNHLLIIGGLLVDDIAIPADSLKPASSNPVKWQHRLGGVAANAARVAIQQLDVHFIASTGDDSNGVRLATGLQSANDKYTLTADIIVRSGQHSDTYTAILEPDGELYLGLADAQLTAQIQWQDIKEHLPSTQPNAVVLDANLSQRCLLEILTLLDAHYETHVPVYALAVSPAKSVRYLPKANKIDVLFCNRREAAALTELDWQSDLDLLADALLRCKFNSFVVTDGAKAIIVQNQSQRAHIAIPAVRINKNVNGAGDALAGATIASVVLGQDLAAAVEDAGMAAAHKVLTGKSEPPLI